MHNLSKTIFPVFVCLLLAAACQPDITPTAVSISTTPLTLPEGFTAVPFITDLSRPTQFIEGPDGRIWIAQLLAGESDAQGQVIAIDPNTGEQSVLLAGLNKPTGIAVLDNALWIAEESRLLRAALDDNLRPQTPEVVLNEMPYNGRSNGTLTVSPDGLLIYETSGRRQGNRAAAGSGTLWALDPAQLDSPTVLATGLKNAYAHVFDANGRLWITEIGDGSVTGADFEGQPPEELNLVIPGADYGWPQCFGDQEPALNRDGTPEVCARTQPPAALFNPQSTPTGIAISPWDEDVLLVARWLGQEVTAVAIHMENGRIVGETRPFIVGFGNPQHLLALPDQTLLVSDYREGVIYKVEQEQ